jgi:hypothetical protein
VTLTATHLLFLADASDASKSMKAYLAPVMTTLIALASVIAVFFLVYGGISYISSSGNPEKLEHAKRVIRNALIGLVMVIGAGTLVAILSHAYASAGPTMTDKMPALTTIKPAQTNGVISQVINLLMGVLANLVESMGQTFLDALKYFTTATPLMMTNSSVFNLWLAIVGITDALFVLVVALLGFHVMSFSTFGLDEIEFKHLLPRIGLTFLLVNTSLFLIDAVISLSNGMIDALNMAFPATSVWSSLTLIVGQANGLGLAGLLIMMAFMVLAVILVIYYVLRLMTLYIGAVLSPIVMMLWLVPGFRYFAEAAARAYISIIFVLFINVVILDLAASIFGGMTYATPDHSLNPLMAMLVGIAMLLALLKTQGVLTQLSYASLGPKTTSQLGSLVTNLVTYRKGAGRSVSGSKVVGRRRGGNNDPDDYSDGAGSGPAPRHAGYPTPTHTAPREGVFRAPAPGSNESPHIDWKPEGTKESPAPRKGKKGLAT